MKRITLFLLLLFVFYAPLTFVKSFAGEKEDLRIYGLQEHMKALQADYQLSQMQLQNAINEKQAVEAKEKADAEKNKKPEKK